MREGYPATAASVPAARDSAAGQVRALRVEESVVRAVALAVTEACANVVIHAYRGQEPGEMTVSVEQRGESLCITVSDDGVGILPRPDSPGLGLGLPLISQLTDTLELRSRPEGGSEVSMRFELSPRRAAA